MDVKIPDKLFFTIGEVSKITDVKPYTLRYWESEFKLLKPHKNAGGQRVYRKKDLELVLYVKKLLHEDGYTISGTKKKLKGEKDNKQLELFREDPKTLAFIRLKSQLKSLLDYLNS